MTPDGLRGGPVATAIRAHRLIVVLRRIEPQAALLALVTELADAGARTFEITFDAPSAEGNLAAVRAMLEARGNGRYLVGAGSVVRRKELEAVRRARADFATSTMLDPSLVDTAVSEGLPFIPGAFTPTEVHAAWSAGATFVKLFPAASVGPAFVRELRVPMPEAELIAAGGVDGTAAPAFLEAGAAAVGIGRALVRSDAATRRTLIAAIAGRTGETA